MKKLFRFVSRILPDKAFLSLKYRLKFGEPMPWKNPVTFNQKIQWLKLYDRKPEYSLMVDKYEAKKLVAGKIGEEYVIPTLGVWDSFDDIDFSKLPEKFVLKCTHDCGSVVICKDKEKFDIEAARKKLSKAMKRNYYYGEREWPYKNVPARIICEEYIKDNNYEFLPVYKFFCFNGEAKIVQTIQNDKQPNETIDYFDRDWQLLNMRQNYPNSDRPIPEPENLKEMIAIADSLSKGFSFIRVDLYVVNGKIYFSEYTFYSDAGFARFEPSAWDKKLGGWI